MPRGNPNWWADKSHVNGPRDSYVTGTHKPEMTGTVVSKTQKWSYVDPRDGRDGQYFAFRVRDDHDNFVRVAAFNENCDRLYDQVQKGGDYSFTNGYVKEEKHDYAQTTVPFEVHMNNHADVEKLE